MRLSFEFSLRGTLVVTESIDGEIHVSSGSADAVPDSSAGKESTDSTVAKQGPKPAVKGKAKARAAKAKAGAGSGGAPSADDAPGAAMRHLDAVASPLTLVIIADRLDRV